MTQNTTKSAASSSGLFIQPDAHLPFSEYITQCSRLIEARRSIAPPQPAPQDNQGALGTPIQCINPQQIIDANSPYELTPQSVATSKQPTYGVLLIHGLLDSPFTLRDIGLHLQQNGILCRSILLPGHGTIPEDLISVTHQDWMQSVHYGIETLRKDVDHIFLLGYSTGAALAVHHAIQTHDISGVVLLAPAIKIKSPLDILMDWHHVIRFKNKKNTWLCREAEIDYTKYHSVPFNAVNQVVLLTKSIQAISRTYTLNCPMLMILSRDDETISSKRAIDFFISQTNRQSRLQLYSPKNHRYKDMRIEIHHSAYPALHIRNFSHVSLPIAPSNPHYGQYGDYIYASHLDIENIQYGAFNRIEASIYSYLYHRKIIQTKHRELTYNPDFTRMSNAIANFIKTTA